MRPFFPPAAAARGVVGRKSVMCNVDGVRAPRRHREGPSRDAGHRRKTATPRAAGAAAVPADLARRLRSARLQLFFGARPSKISQAGPPALLRFAEYHCPLSRSAAIEAAQIRWGSCPYYATHPPAPPRGGSALAGQQNLPGREEAKPTRHARGYPRLAHHARHGHARPAKAHGGLPRGGPPGAAYSGLRPRERRSRPAEERREVTSYCGRNS